VAEGVQQYLVVPPAGKERNVRALFVLVLVAIAVLMVGLLWLALYAVRRVDGREEKRDALVARADQQHAWVLAGDDRGIYGDYPPRQIA
jgi:cytoskeletal protein RodZ